MIFRVLFITLLYNLFGQEVINTIGGVQVLFPLLESVEGLGELNLLYPFHQTVTPEWTMSSTALSGTTNKCIVVLCLEEIKGCHS